MTAIDPKLETALSSIQPLRDLAKNWDVDIASCLEDYLQEIAVVAQHEQSPVTIDATNFAQAALLLHNSSNVYSRKVEYLYTLVYSALENLNSQNKSNNKQNSSRKVDAEVEEFQQFDDQMEFLLLDDVIPTDESKIDLPSAWGNHNLDATGFLPCTTRLSLGMSATVDRSASVVAQNAVLSTLTNSCGILHQTDGNSQGMFYMRGTQDPQVTKNRLSSFGSVLNITSDENVLTHVDDAVDEHFGGHDDDDDNDGPAFEFVDSIDQSVPANVPKPAVQSRPKKQNSAWDLLDPHNAGNVKGRPLRIGTTFILPEGILAPPSQFVTGAGTNTNVPKRRPLIAEEIQPICIAAATFKATLANQQRRREGQANSDSDSVNPNTIMERPLVPLQGLAFGGEFAYIAQAATKRKAAERREKRKLLLSEPEAIPPEEADQLMGYDDNDYCGGDDDSYSGDTGNNGGLQVFEDVFAANDNRISNPHGATFEELCRAHIQAFAKGAEKYRSETNLTQRVGDWQSKLSPILDEEAARPEFDIHVYGEHVIESIKKHADQQMGATGSSKSNKTYFSSLTNTTERYNVCRLFLASLSLINSGNVEFNAEEGKVMGPDTLIIELLNSTVDRPMQTFLAPSTMEGKS